MFVKEKEVQDESTVEVDKGVDDTPPPPPSRV